MNTAPELVCPAGDLHKLRIAIDYGADAVYFGATQYSLRTASGNISTDDMAEAIAYAHRYGRKAYLTLNVVAHDSDVEGMLELTRYASQCGADAAIVSDLGVFTLLRQHIPDLPLHISTQANTTNTLTAKAWFDMGASRIVLARELGRDEIAHMQRALGDQGEFEVFVHGAMCMAYSGRCLLSKYLASRDANAGACAQTCRWHYHLVEEKRPGEYIPVYEDEGGSFIFNSKDLCLIAELPQLVDMGVSSLKVEGRVKSAYYVAGVTAAYRSAIDAVLSDPDAYDYRPYLAELEKVSHRVYGTGFWYGEGEQIYDTASYIRSHAVMGYIHAYIDGVAHVEQKGKLCTGDTVEILCPDGSVTHAVIGDMFDGDGNIIHATPHAAERYTTQLPHAAAGAFIRKASGVRSIDGTLIGDTL